MDHPTGAPAPHAGRATRLVSESFVARWWRKPGGVAFVSNSLSTGIAHERRDTHDFIGRVVSNFIVCSQDEPGMRERFLLLAWIQPWVHRHSVTWLPRASASAHKPNPAIPLPELSACRVIARDVSRFRKALTERVRG